MHYTNTTTSEIRHSTPLLLEEIRIQIPSLSLYKYTEIQCAVSPSMNEVASEYIVHSSTTGAIGFMLNDLVI